jgi:hypothetical protein
VAHFQPRGGDVLSQDPLRWFLENCEVDMVESTILAYAAIGTVYNDRVKSAHSKHHADQRVTQMLSLFKLRLKDRVACHPQVVTMKANQLIGRIPNERIPFDEMQRRTYTDAEMDRMLDFVKSDPLCLLMLVFLREVGLRAGAISHMM